MNPSQLNPLSRVMVILLLPLSVAGTAVYFSYNKDMAAVHGEPAQAPALQLNNAPVSRDLVPVSEIFLLQLMGKAPPAQPAVTAVPEILPETELQLQLIGAFASDSNDIAAALIRVGSDNAKYFRINDEIVDGVTLHSVSVGDVTLLNKSGLERLAFARHSPDIIRDRISVAARQPTGNHPPQSQSPHKLAATSRSNAVHGSTTEGSSLSLRQRLETYRSTHQ